MPPELVQWLVLDRELSLTNVLNPQMTLWFQGKLDSYSHFRVQVSTDGGLNWGDLSAFNLDYGYNSATWTRRQASLQSYTNRTVRLRFQANSFWGSAPYTDFNVDKITIAEMPAAVMVETLTPHLRSVDVTWSPSALGGTFQRNEVYRATHATVTQSDTLIGTFTDPAVTNLTDTGLSIGTTYYYKVFTVDTNDTYIPSNERSTTTVPVIAAAQRRV